MEITMTDDKLSAKNQREEIIRCLLLNLPREMLAIIFSKFRSINEAWVLRYVCKEFSSGLAHENVPPYDGSEPIPDKQNGSEVTVIGRTFDEVVLNSRENVLLDVHTPWCHNCEAMRKQVDKLSKHFKGFENLVFARIDASAKEHPKLNESDDYPTILLQKTGEKEHPVR